MSYEKYDKMFNVSQCKFCTATHLNYCDTSNKNKYVYYSTLNKNELIESILNLHPSVTLDCFEDDEFYMVDQLYMNKLIHKISL